MATFINTINVICFFNLALVVLLLWCRKNNSSANFYLGGLVFLTFMALVGNFIMYQLYTPYALFKKTEMAVTFLFGFFLWSHINQILGGRTTVDYKYLLHFVPSLAMLFIAIKDFFLSEREKQLIIDEIFSGTHLEYNILNLLFVLHTFAYILFCHYYIRRVESNVSQFYSNSDFIKIKWARQFIYILIFLNIAGIIIYSIPVLFTEVSAKSIELIYIPIICSGMQLYIVYKAFSSSAILTQKEFDTYSGELEDFHFFNKKPVAKVSGERAITVQTEESYQKILNLVESKKLYLQESFNLKSLSDISLIPVHQLSQIINLHTKKNFSEWINYYRIEEAKKLLVLKPDYTIEGVAYEAGFGSKATFNRVFKKHTGATPSEYIKSISSIVLSESQQE